MKLWKVSTGGKRIPTDIIVPPHKTKQLENVLAAMKIRHGIIINDLQRYYLFLNYYGFTRSEDVNLTKKYLLRKLTIDFYDVPFYK